jgi:hypothetical protein
MPRRSIAHAGHPSPHHSLLLCHYLALTRSDRNSPRLAFSKTRCPECEWGLIRFSNLSASREVAYSPTAPPVTTFAPIPTNLGIAAAKEPLFFLSKPQL